MGRAVKVAAVGLAAVLGLSACGGGSGDAGAPTTPQTVESAPADERAEVRGTLGTPDYFELLFDTVGGQPARLERWSYLDEAATFEFLDGVLLWTSALDEAPPGSVAAHFYDPDQFAPGMDIAAVRELVEGELTEVTLDELGAVDGTAYAGPQLVVMFDDKGLAGVQTFALSPEGA